MSQKYKVLYFINHAPNYRDVFLRELGKYVDLTVVSYAGAEANLEDPVDRSGYKYICLRRFRILKWNLNIKEFTLAYGDYDVIIVGYTLWHPFRMINLFRRNKRVIAEGLIYGKSNNIITKLLRKWCLEAAEGVLVYSQIVKEKVEREISKPIVSFNNTSFSRESVNPLLFNFEEDTLNLVWVGRYSARKKVERLVDTAAKEKRLQIRLIGPGIKENINLKRIPKNVAILDAAYGDELTEHFMWSHAVFNPGGAGLLVMNAARFGRPIFIDSNSHHGPEIQLAKIAGLDLFVDFGEPQQVSALIHKCIAERDYLQEKGHILCETMKKEFTVEYMAQQYYKAINGVWH